MGSGSPAVVRTDQRVLDVYLGAPDVDSRDADTHVAPAGRHDTSLRQETKT